VLWVSYQEVESVVIATTPMSISWEGNVLSAQRTVQKALRIGTISKTLVSETVALVWVTNTGESNRSLWFYLLTTRKLLR